ncbi:MAG: FAD-dependent oxidoreductase [Spirochaetaceae bacterium]|nr:MAG: FAD-dependent oxidoreductase [Spirochaetaceae bacterium]
MHVAIVGGGGTGAAILHDLTQRGFRCTLLERGELTSGTTGRHHGQLHSGARYAVGDVEIARECMEEVTILRRIAAESIEMNYGLFIALDDDDVDYSPEFERACSDAGIPNRRLSTSDALRHEPGINPRTRHAVMVPDGTIDAYRLPLQFFATARSGGATIRTFCEAIGIDSANGRVSGVTVRDHRTGRDERIAADIVINAAGPWAGAVAALAGVDLPITPAPGTMVAVKGRLCNMVVSHLHPPGDGDIIVPQRNLSIVGSTQWEVDDPDAIRTPPDDIHRLLDRACDLVPAFADAEYHAAWTAARPLSGRADAGGRQLSRNFQVITHAGEGSDDVAGFFSVTGGKATVLRAMGEAVADQVCRYAGLSIAGRTADTPLLAHRDFWRQTGRVGEPVA